MVSELWATLKRIGLLRNKGRMYQGDEAYMKKYLSYGGGVNSVAMMLYLIDHGEKFEAVMSDTGCEYPETYLYLEMFQIWLRFHGHKPITVLTPSVEGYNNLFKYCFDKCLIPSRKFKWCTDKFKQKGQREYFKKPCFVYIGIDAGEAHRAKIVGGDIEQRYPLIENNINRDGCKDIIKAHGLPIPRKSACYICYNAGPGELKQLRTTHPDLFCHIRQLETRCNEKRAKSGKKPIYLKDKPIDAVVEENQIPIFKQDEYPPCQCGL
jgi:hypothetical protein